MNDQITYAYLHSGSQIRMFFHFLFNQSDSFRRYVTAIVVKTLELPKKWKESVAYTTTQFIIVTYFTSIDV